MVIERKIVSYILKTSPENIKTMFEEGNQIKVVLHDSQETATITAERYRTVKRKIEKHKKNSSNGISLNQNLLNSLKIKNIVIGLGLFSILVIMWGAFSQTQRETDLEKAEKIANKFMDALINNEMEKVKNEICYSTPSELERPVSLSLFFSEQFSPPRYQKYEKILFETISPPRNILGRYNNYLEKNEFNPSEMYNNFDFEDFITENENEIFLVEGIKDIEGTQVFSIIYSVTFYERGKGTSTEKYEILIWRMEDKKKHDKLYQLIEKEIKQNEKEDSNWHNVLFHMYERSSLSLHLEEFYATNNQEYNNENDVCISGVILDRMSNIN